MLQQPAQAVVIDEEPPRVVRHGVELARIRLRQAHHDRAADVEDRSKLTSQQRLDLAETIGKPSVAIEWFDEPDVPAKARNWIESARSGQGGCED